MGEFRKILINGKEVDAGNLQALPESVRQVLADQNQNGVPDFLEGILNNPLVKQALERGGYQSIEQAPPEIREKLQALLAKFGHAAGSAPPVQVQTTSIATAQVPAPSVTPADWRQSYSLEEPRSISGKTIFASLAAIFILLVAAWAAWMLLFHR